MSKGVTRRGFFAFCGAATATTLVPALELPAAPVVTDEMLRDFYLTEISAVPLESVLQPAFETLGRVFTDSIVETMNRPSFCSRIFQENVTTCPSTSTSVALVKK